MGGPMRPAGCTRPRVILQQLLSMWRPSCAVSAEAARLQQLLNPCLPCPSCEGVPHTLEGPNHPVMLSIPAALPYVCNWALSLGAFCLLSDLPCMFLSWSLCRPPAFCIHV